MRRIVRGNATKVSADCTVHRNTKLTVLITAADEAKIEKAFKKGQKTLKLSDKYKIDFQLMVQHRIEVRAHKISPLHYGRSHMCSRIAHRIRTARGPSAGRMLRRRQRSQPLPPPSWCPQYVPRSVLRYYIH